MNNKFTIKGLLLFFVMVLAGLNLQAQITVKGTVSDNDTGETLIGASIIVKGSSQGVVTDFDGQYSIRIKVELPVTLVVSYVGYDDKEFLISEAQKINVELSESVVTTATAVVTTQRISDKQKSAPLTVESLDAIAIKETSSDNFYDGLGNLKGVDLTAASLGFKVINTRGFNSTSPVRSLQIIDGVDNQAPGLNFSLGNFLGAPELDVRRVDIIQGASSSFYGPNAFNGVISIETKSPFNSEGLSIQMKVGERSLFNPELRWADSFVNKDGHKYIGYKIALSYLSANDWEANNDGAVDGTLTAFGNAGGWDRVNTYGDEYDQAGDYSSPTNYYQGTAGLINIHRSGYDEVDLVDYDTRNYKALGSVYIRTNPEKEHLSPELILGMSYGSGTTVYQGDNRFSLRGINFIQPKIEFRKKDDFFIRAYMSREDAGESYDPYFTALRLQREAQTNGTFFSSYEEYWVNNNVHDQMIEMGYPEGMFIVDDDGNLVFEFDREGADAWLEENRDFMNAKHNEARQVVEMADEANGVIGNYEPGTLEFDEAFKRITSSYNNEEGKGTRFYDKSALYHLHAEKQFKTTWADLVLGANGRVYKPDSRGTIFSDTAGIQITNSEWGAYLGLSRSIIQDDVLRGSVTVRVDKNENFDLIATPAASLVWKPRPNHYLRVSFSSGIRNPTLSDQYLFLDVGPAVLSGNLNGATNVVSLESFRSYLENFLNRDLLVYRNIDPVMPEKVKTMEAGYRATLFNNMYVDAGYYYSIYNDFIGYSIVLDVEFEDEMSFIPKNVDVFRYASNAKEQVTTQGFSIGLNYYFGTYFQANGNYSFNALTSSVDDPIIPAFNTPKNKFNLGISGRDFPIWKLKHLGFNVNYKWVEGFLFEGSPQFTGFVPSYGQLNGQINYLFKKYNITFKLGATNILNNLAFQTYGGPRIGRLAYASVLYEWKKNN